MSAEFRIEFSKTASGYDVALSSSAGEVVQPFVPPFTNDELEKVAGELSESGDAGLATAKRVGARLFEALFQGEALAAFKSCVDRAESVRITLRFRDAPELGALPWELLYREPTDTFLSLSASTPIVRYVEVSEPVRAVSAAKPLVILGIVARPSDVDELDVESEKEKLLEALRTSAHGDLMASGAVRVDWLEPATIAALRTALRRSDFHVVHFIGHGEEGKLLFERADGTADRVPGTELGTLLRDETTVRLAVLNACKGGKAGATFAAVAVALVRQRTPAVIAMQFAFGDVAAVVFAGELYAALADGVSLEAALADARGAIYSRLHTAEWATPVLFSRMPDAPLIEDPIKESPEIPRRWWLLVPPAVAVAVIVLLVAGWGAGWFTGPPAKLAVHMVDGARSESLNEIVRRGRPDFVVYDEVRIDTIERGKLQLAATSDFTPEQADRLLSLTKFERGHLSDQTRLEIIKLRAENTRDDFTFFVIADKYFALEDNLGRRATLLFFCCAADGIKVEPGGWREVELIYLSHADWGPRKEGAVNHLLFKVEGFTPILSATWTIPIKTAVAD